MVSFGFPMILLKIKNRQPNPLKSRNCISREAIKRCIFGCSPLFLSLLEMASAFINAELTNYHVAIEVYNGIALNQLNCQQLRGNTKEQS